MGLKQSALRKRRARRLAQPGRRSTKPDLASWLITTHHSWSPIDHQIDGDPNAYEEVPDDRVYVYAEALLRPVAATQENQDQDDREHQVSDVIERVQTEEGPYVRTVDVGFPVEIEGVPLGNTHGKCDTGQDRVKER